MSPDPTSALRMAIFDQLSPELQEKLRFCNEGYDTVTMLGLTEKQVMADLDEWHPPEGCRTMRFEEETCRRRFMRRRCAV